MLFEHYKTISISSSFSEAFLLYFELWLSEDTIFYEIKRYLMSFSNENLFPEKIEWRKKEKFEIFGVCFVWSSILNEIFYEMRNLEENLWSLSWTGHWLLSIYDFLLKFISKLFRKFRKLPNFIKNLWNTRFSKPFSLHKCHSLINLHFMTLNPWPKKISL